MGILFKAKRVDNSNDYGEWAFGDPYHEKNNKGDQIRVMIVEYRPDLMLVSGAPNNNQWWSEVIPETLCQFTGFTYKDQEVFQGDTFKVWLEDLVEPEGGYWWNSEVKQHLGCWILAQIGHDYKGTPIEQCELLFTTDYELVPTGNIHDKK